MNWPEIIIKSYESESRQSKGFITKPIFMPPTSKEHINEIEKQLGAIFPEDLTDLLIQTNGFSEQMTIEHPQEPFDIGSVLFTIDKIASVTESFRRKNLPANIKFSEMVFIGTPHTDGIYFTFRNGENKIYAWYPIDGEFRVIASNLYDFLTGWLSGELFI